MGRVILTRSDWYTVKRIDPRKALNHSPAAAATAAAAAADYQRTQVDGMKKYLAT